MKVAMNNWNNSNCNILDHFIAANKMVLIGSNTKRKIQDYKLSRYAFQRIFKKINEWIGKKYSVRYLFDIRKLYLFSKVHPVGAQLTMSHYRLLFAL